MLWRHDFPIIVLDVGFYEDARAEEILALREWTARASLVVVANDGQPLLDFPGTVGALRRGASRSELREVIDRAALHHATKDGIRRRRSPCRVLIVDGFPPDALATRDVLCDAGGDYQAELCGTLAEATARLGETDFSAILTELSLPDARGLDAVAKLRAAAPDVPLLVVCRNDDEAMAACAARLGAASYLVKEQIAGPTLACAIRACLERKAHETDLESRAVLDTLTGLPNRSLFLDRVQALAEVAERSGEPLGVLVLDLDGFKSVNDCLGHLAGDDVLVQVATYIQATLRATDFAFRVGGDEFVVLAPGAHNPEFLAERLVAAVDLSLESDGGPLHVTASVGSARYPLDGGTIEEVLAQADRNMYASKHAKALDADPGSPRSH